MEVSRESNFSDIIIITRNVGVKMGLQYHTPYQLLLIGCLRRLGFDTSCIAGQSFSAQSTLGERFRVSFYIGNSSVLDGYQYTTPTVATFTSTLYNFFVAHLNILFCSDILVSVKSEDFLSCVSDRINAIL